MGKENIVLPWNIERRLDTTISHIKKEASELICKDLKKMYNSVIREFYRSYHPKSYDRTYSTYAANNLYNNDNYSSIVDDLGDGFKVEFLVSDYFIKSQPYEEDRTWVFTRTFVKGIHGWIPGEWDSYYHGGMFDLDWRASVFVSQPASPLSPTPKARMDERHKKYKNPQRLRKKIKPIVDKHMNKFLSNLGN